MGVSGCYPSKCSLSAASASTGGASAGRVWSRAAVLQAWAAVGREAGVGGRQACRRNSAHLPPRARPGAKRPGVADQPTQRPMSLAEG